MKSSTLCFVALLCLGIAGQAAGQTVDSYRKAGAAYFKAGQFSESVKAYQQVIRLKPDDADAYEQLGEAFTRLNMNKEAAEAFEKEADLLLSVNEPSRSSPTPAVTSPSQNATAPVQSRPAAANGQLTHKVGQRVEYVEDGKWYKAVITEVRDDSANQLDGKLYAPYRVHSINYNDLGGHWVCCADFTDRRSQLRPAGSGPTELVPGGAAGEANDPVLKAMGAVNGATPAPSASGGVVPAKQYHCVFFAGDHLEDVAPFTITGRSTYTDSVGALGTYGFNSASSIVTFRGGNYDGQRAQYETSGDQPRLHILGQTGRPVIDCD